MSLHRWQATLLQALRNTSQAPNLAEQWRKELSTSELTQLQSLHCDKGAEVTQEVANWWRQARLSTALPFSMKLIQALKRESLLAQYQLTPFKTLFFLREAEIFLEFLSKQKQVPEILKDLVCFECQLHYLKRRPLNTTYTQQLSLQYCPQSTITSLLQNTALPEKSPHEIKVFLNSNWPELWRFEKDAPASQI